MHSLKQGPVWERVGTRATPGWQDKWIFPQGLLLWSQQWLLTLLGSVHSACYSVTFKDDPKQYRLSIPFTWELNLREVTGLAQSHQRSSDLDPRHLATTCYELF